MTGRESMPEMYWTPNGPAGRGRAAGEGDARQEGGPAGRLFRSSPVHTHEPPHRFTHIARESNDTIARVILAIVLAVLLIAVGATAFVAAPPAKVTPGVAVVRTPVVDGRREVVAYELIGGGDMLAAQGCSLALDAFAGPTDRLAQCGIVKIGVAGRSHDELHAPLAARAERGGTGAVAS